MWILRYLFVLIILIVILGFALQNMDPTDVNIANTHFEDVPLYWVVFAAFGLGAVAFLPLALFHSFKHKLEVRRKESEIRKLKSELAKTESSHVDAKDQWKREEHAEPDEL